ncbi:glycoside hydrolase [Apodospora peruviana]|uniref:Glycoside hydrolase n=1 Tax=Apodospora peruviana TaxID=516989 RepID=A0AAE0ID47_9PEZI|nr:glycoside hydrolase [Apodospora peruviana]
MRLTTARVAVAAAGLALVAHSAAHILPRQHSLEEQPSPYQSLQQRDPDAVPDARHAAKAAIDAMNTAFYSQAAGRWADTWWVSAIALQSMLDYMHKTNSCDYMDRARHTIELQKAPVPGREEGGGNFRADSTDDTGWWALAMISMFDLTKDHSYLNISKLDEAYIYKYWTKSPCAGGVYQDIREETYKNAIANELYIFLAAALHNRIPGDKAYLKKAEHAWEWFKKSGMVNIHHRINDGLVSRADGTCVNNGQPVWSYNQGVILGALTELYRATKNKGYLASARKIADGALAKSSPLVRKDGILADPCPGSCNGDMQAFKGIFARNLGVLDSAVGGHPYQSFLQKNAKSAYSKSRDAAKNLYDVH